MAANKKKVEKVSSNLKNDVDAAVAKAAVEVVAEAVNEVTAEAPIETSEHTAGDLVDFSDEGYGASEEDKVLDTRKGRRSPFKFPLTVTKGGRRLKGLLLDHATETMSSLADGSIDNGIPKVIVNGQRLLPIPGTVSSMELSSPDGIIEDYTNNVHRLVNLLDPKTVIDFYHFCFQVDGQVKHLYLDKKSSYEESPDDSRRWMGKPRTALLVIINGSARNVNIERANVINGATVENSTLEDSFIARMTRDQMEQNYVPGVGYPYTRSDYHPRGFDIEEECVIRDVWAQRSTVINSSVEKLNLNDTHIVKSRIVVSNYGSAKSSTLGNCHIETPIFYADGAHLAINVRGVPRVSIGAVNHYDGMYYDFNHNIEINNQFGVGDFKFMQDTKVNYVTTDAGMLLEIPSHFSRNGYRERFILIPFDTVVDPHQPRWMQDEGISKLITEAMVFSRNGKALAKPDTVQQSYLTNLIESVESRMKVLQLLRAIKDNSHTVLPRTDRYDDHIPF